MSLINSASFNSDLLPKLIKKWFGEYQDLPEIYNRFMNVESMDQAYEIEATLTPMGALQRKNQGSVLRLDGSAEAYKPVYQSVVYALGFAITKEMIRDGKAFANAKRFVEMLKRGGRITKEIACASIINNAGTSGYTMTGGDGVILASASHPSRYGNQSNILSGGADLSEAAIEALNVNIMNAVDNRGLRIGLMIKDLLVSPSQRADAHRILESKTQAETANHTANFLRDENVVKSVIINPYLTSTTQWQVTTTAQDGLKLKVRQEMEMDTDNDFMTKNGLYSVDMRIVPGWSDFRGVYFSL